MRPFDTSFSRRRVGADAVNVQLEERPPELRMAVATGRRGLVYAENTRLVAVKCQRLAVLIDVPTRGLEKSEGRLCTVEENLHQSAFSIVDKYQCRACGTAVFEPMMFAAIDLNELADARPPQSGLLNFRCPGLPGVHKPTAICSCLTVSLAKSMPCLVLSFSAANVGPKSAYVDLRSLITWSAMASCSRLLLGRLKRLVINPT